MACNKPLGDCTNVSPCGASSGCGCSDPTPEPILPRCQDAVLAAGTYENATIVVNANGCIVLVESGEPPVYTPDDCCGGTSSGGGTQGVKGDDGEPGDAASIDVEPSIEVNSGNYWSVENVGTSSAAILRFRSPPSTAGGGGSTTGITGTVAGLRVSNGAVQALPSALVTAVTAVPTGEHASKITMTYAPPDTAHPDAVMVTLGLDLFHDSLVQYVDAKHQEQDNALAALRDTVATQQNSITALEQKVSTLQTSNTEMEADIAKLRADVDRLMEMFPTDPGGP